MNIKDYLSIMDPKLLVEGKLDLITRSIVRDIITFFKYQRLGEFGLPKELTGEEVYEFNGLETKFEIFLDLQQNENVNGFDVDAEYWDDEQIMYITIVTKPDPSNNVLQDLLKELNEVVRHELEHIKQHEDSYDFPKEPKSHEKYYTQPHELDAQRAGFRRRSKIEKIPMDKMVRNWFEKNQHKYKMTPDQVERVIQKILSK